MIRAVAATLAFALAAGCGGPSPRDPAAPLPPAEPGAVRALVRGARAMARGTPRGDRAAREHLARALGIDDTLWEAHYDLGLLDRRAGDLVAAEGRFEAALAIHPGASAPALALAEARYARGDLDGAAAGLRAWLADREDAPGAEVAAARVALAAVERRRGRLDAALEAARAVLLRDPGHVPALAEVGRVHRARGRLDVAELVFRRALDAAPDDASLRNDLGLLALARGDTQAAFVELARALEADPAYAPAHLNQALVLLRAGDHDGAAARYRAVLVIDPGHVDARIGLGVALRGLRRPEEAARIYRGVLEERPSHPAALFDLALVYADHLGRPGDARPLWLRYLEVAPLDATRERALAARRLEELPPPSPTPPETSP